VSAAIVAESGARRMRLSVADTGPGIPADKLEQVFEEFYQLGNLERDRSKGLGLGLSIVRRLAVLLGGQVRVSSTVGTGSRFTLELPCGRAPVPAAGDGVPRGGVVASLAVPRRALLIDDERDIRESLQTFLSTQGWQVVAAAGLPEALDALHAGFKPEAIVVDFRLQGGASGLDALQAIRALGHVVPTWLITGDTEPARIAAARAAGVPVIYKPVDGIELARLMQAAVA
jgi:two-component system, sensor histidine kinase